MIAFPRVLVLCEMQSVFSRIWTRVTVSISYHGNHYTTIVPPKVFRTIIFIFIAIFTMFWLMCSPNFFRCFLLNLGANMELQTTFFIYLQWLLAHASVNHNQLHVLNIPVLLLACCQDWTCNLQMIVIKKLREPTTVILCVLLDSSGWFWGLINLIFLYHYELLLLCNQAIGLMSRVFMNGPGDWGSIPGWVIPKIQKMVLNATLLNTQHYKVSIKGKVEQSREWRSTLSYSLVL